jgi:xanthine dehydrogenase accessory factor
MGHVGLELARILARHDVELHLVDSRADQLADDRLACLADALATVHVHHAPLPEMELGGLPAGSHVLILTHDHAEDFALCDAALRCRQLGSIGVIGSAAKWQRFRQGLLVEGHTEEEIDRITSPIGDPTVVGKEPATIALAVATALVHAFGGVRTRR